jgi:hypothetical protein
MRYILDQKDSSILEIIRNLFGFGKVTLRSTFKKKKLIPPFYPSTTQVVRGLWGGSQTDGVYRYTATGFKSMNDVISYFKLFPLLTNKARSFDKWLTIHKIVSNKLHLTEEGLGQVSALQKQININNGMTKKTGSAHP